MPRWSTSPSADSAVRARFALAALAGHAALAAVVLVHAPRKLTEPPAPASVLLEWATPAPPALATPDAPPPQAALVAADLAEPPAPAPFAWPSPAPARPAPRPTTRAAPAPAAPADAPIASAPPADASALSDWQAALLAWIERNRRYPPSARLHHEEGVVVLRFALDPGGRVLHAEILAGSGSPALDAAALVLLRDAILPAPPPGLPAAARVVTAPIRYRLH